MMVVFSNLKARVLSATDEEREWLREALAFGDDKMRFRANPTADGRVHLYSSIDDSFPAGYVPVVKQLAASAGVQLDLMDKRVCPAQPVPSDLAWLRDYQLAAVERGISQTRGLLWLSTAAGKSEIAIGLMERIPCRWLFLVHRSTLLTQMAARYGLRTKLEAGMVGQGTWGEERVTVATFATVHAALQDRRKRERAVRLLEGVGGIITDECHVCPAATFLKIINRTRNAYWRFGLSATPLARGDQRSVYTIAAIGPVIYRLRPEVLIAAGVIARPTVRLVALSQESDRTTWQEVYSECVVRSPARNALVVRMAQRASKPCMVFVRELEHGWALLEQLQAANLGRCAFVHGQTPLEERDEVLARMRREDLDVVVCTVVMQEGVDVPSLRSVIVAAGGQSTIAALQRVGRAMRVVDGKTECEVYDVQDGGNKWLKKHTAARLRAYRGESYEVLGADI